MSRKSTNLVRICHESRRLCARGTMPLCPYVFMHGGVVSPTCLFSCSRAGDWSTSCFAHHGSREGRAVQYDPRMRLCLLQSSATRRVARGQCEILKRVTRVAMQTDGAWAYVKTWGVERVGVRGGKLRRRNGRKPALASGLCGPVRC